MPKPIPIFKDHDETYRADACMPLVRAAKEGEVRLRALVHGHYPGSRLPAQVLPEVKTIGHWDAGADQNWGLPRHRNEGIELTLLESGNLGFEVDGRKFTLRPDDLTLTRPWQEHQVGDPNVGAGRLHWIILDVGVRRPNQSWKWPSWLLLTKADRCELTSILRHNEQPVWRASGEMRHCFQAIAEAVETDRRGSSVSRLTIRINELALLLLDMLRRNRVHLDHSLSSSRRTVELFLADLREHPEHLARDWTIGEMANSCGLGITQFVHHVRRISNMTPMHYLNHCRLNVAVRMLREQPRASVTDVSIDCGFYSSQYFATVFRQRFGCSPTTFRQHAVGLARSLMSSGPTGAARLGNLARFAAHGPNPPCRS